MGYTSNRYCIEMVGLLAGGRSIASVLAGRIHTTSFRSIPSQKWHQETVHSIELELTQQWGLTFWQIASWRIFHF